MPRPARNHARGKNAARTPAANHAGVHLLRNRSVGARLVRSSAVGPGDLVMEFGAGLGALTAPLAATGARVIAVERDPKLAAALRRRFADHPGVCVVEADARTVALPHRPFTVVASIPYAISTALLRRLLDPARTAIAGADLLVEWGFAKRMTAPQPRDRELAWWQDRFELRIAGRVGPDAFRPAPSVGSAHLVVRRRDHVAQNAPRVRANRDI